MLGVRPGEDAMSVFLDPARIPNPIRPKDVPNAYGEPGYNAETVLYALDVEELAAFQLSLGDVNRKTHGGVGPAGACDHDELQRLLTATRPKWRKA